MPIRMLSKINCVFIFSFLFISGCSKSKPPTEPNNKPVSIYFNSFETDADTVGWKGLDCFNFRNDAPKNGGNRSLFVTGACLVPHAYFDIEHQSEDCYLLVRCWGKILQIGGGINLELLKEGFPSGCYISIEDTSWTFCESEDTLFCPSKTTIRISLHSGGIVQSSMLVDLLEVLKIK